MILMKRQTLNRALEWTPKRLESLRRLASTLCKEDGDFIGPSINTDVPGPVSKNQIKELSHLQNVDNMHFVVDYEKSKGNYVADVDGNIYLDVNQQNSSLPLGYNHTAVLKAVQSKEHLTFLMNKPPLTSVLSGYQGKKLKELLLKVAPSGLHSVHASECGACSVHNATKAAFIRYMAYQRGDACFNSSDLVALFRQECSGTSSRQQGCFDILTKESQDLLVMSFSSSVSQDRQGSVMLRPGELILPFPNCKHPWDENCGHNLDEESKCLEKVFHTFKEYIEKGRHIAAIIVEPVQNKGNRYASSNFFLSLQAIVREFNSTFIVDERFTGLGATGYFWAHEEWNLAGSPDIVILPRRMPIGGFYFNEEFMPSPVKQVINAWIGDSSKLLLLQAILKEINEQDLMTRTKDAGQALTNGLLKLEEKFPDLVASSRGKGTFCSLELKDSSLQKKFSHELRRAGVEHVATGSSTSFRPPLIFTNKHASLLCDIIEATLEKCRHTE